MFGGQLTAWIFLKLHQRSLVPFQEKKKIRIMRVNLIQGLGKRVKAKIETMQEMLNVDLEELTDKQTEMNSTLEGINSKITEAEEMMNDLEDRMV